MNLNGVGPWWQKPQTYPVGGMLAITEQGAGNDGMSARYGFLAGFRVLHERFCSKYTAGDL